MKTLRLPLPDKVHDQIRRVAEHEGRPEDEIVRHAIDHWLDTTKRSRRHREILAYARKVAGSTDDLDVELESAGLWT